MRAVAEILASLGAPRLVVVGDLLLDRYLSGVVNRISPEAPVQILRVEEETERLGGAGSVAVNVGVLGASTVLLGVVGQDVAGDRVGQLAAAAGVELDTVVEDGRRTSVKTRHVARSHTSAQQVLRVDQETVGPVEASTEAAIRARLETRLPHADAVLLSDYGKGVLTPTLIAWILERCRAQGIPAVVDPKGRDFQRYRGAAGLTPNRPETIVATGIEIGDGDLAAAERAACALVGALDLDFALVTLDREGMYLKVSDSPGRHLATTPREVFDVTGAGDMVISVLAVALASGASPEEAATLANVAAGLEVEHLGVVPVTREEIAARLALGVDAAATKVLDRAEVASLSARCRAEGRRVVFTNGCFDVLHAGHARFLQQARAEGDVLVVGMNDDPSVRRLKGPGRPVNEAADRAAVLAALAAVDHVVLFGEDTPLALIETLVPDVLVKGEDWREKGVVGREVVEARGGRVVLLPLLEGRGTTEMLERLGGG